MTQYYRQEKILGKEEDCRYMVKVAQKEKRSHARSGLENRLEGLCSTLVSVSQYELCLVFAQQMFKAHVRKKRILNILC